ncbi:MAG: aminotransferase class V-fold PLP-dependent enzyme [Cyanobacteriota bacterium]|nr:aminotransferase class V-fold PLP-dependent enzyme [Cyanobacteriota bacterium]
MTTGSSEAVASAHGAAALRRQMPALANKTYFNYGGQGPLPLSSLAAMTASWQRIQELGPFTDAVWPFVGQLGARLRGRLASWLGVEPERIAFTENVTSGCVLPLWGLPWQPGDELLLGDAEHPGVVAACRELARRHSLSLATLPVAQLRGCAETAQPEVLECLERTLTPRTRLVVLSHLLWNTGQRMPIEAVAGRLAQHPRHPWLLVDGAQSLGSLVLDGAAAAADIYACTGHKWCCGPEGLGAVAVSPRLLQEASPTLIGWRSLRDEGQGASAFHRDARRFEVATSCVPLMAGLEQSLQLLEEVGSAAARAGRIRGLSQRLWRGLQGIVGIHTLLLEPPPAGLVSFQLDRLEPASLVSHLGEQTIWLRSLDEPACVRACTHVTTTEAEVDRLLEALAAVADPQ